MTLGWKSSPDTNVVGYFQYFGPASGNYTNKINVGNVTNATIYGLVEGSTYFFAVTAYDAAGQESVPSNEVAYAVPSYNNPPAIALTSPLNGAVYAAPATISVAASLTANGHSITKVQFFSSTTLMGEDTSEPYSLVWSNVSAGSYSLAAKGIYDAGSVVSSLPITCNVTNLPGLPAPWETADIGSIGVAGSAIVSNGLFIVKGTGTLGSTADNFRLVYQTLDGDGEIKAQLISLDNIGSSGRIGVMIRESLTSGSAYVFMGVSPDGPFRWMRRNKTDGTSWTTTSATMGIPPNIWLRLVRTGNALYGYQSDNGTNWIQLSARSSVNMGKTIYIGLAVASGSSTMLNTATYENIMVVP